MFRFNQASQHAKDAREAAKFGVPQESDRFNTTNANMQQSEGFSVTNVSYMNQLPEAAFNYQVFASKLVKFRDTKLRAVKFTQSGSRGKLLISFDQRGIIRFHKIRGLKTLQAHDFADPDQNLDYVFTNQIETTRIELKHEMQDLIKPTTLSQDPLQISQDQPSGNVTSNKQQ